MLTAAIAASLVASAPQAIAPVTESDPPAVAEAKANRTRVKFPPEIKSDKPKWFDAEMEAQRKLGHHGRVVVEGIIGLEGRYSRLRVRTSSRAPGFDALALRVAAEAQFSPARDATGSPVAIWAAFPLEKLPTSFADRSLFGYRCDEAVRDFDWWRGAWPEAKVNQYATFLMIAGFEFVQLRNAPAQVRAKLADLAIRWNDGLTTCRTSPTKKLLDALQSPLAR
jgi:TonB family protein